MSSHPSSDGIILLDRLPWLSSAPGYARPVAEMVLAMAISLARRMHEADAALRLGKEFKGDNDDSFMLHGKPLGLVGFGNLGRALLPLLRPFSRELLVHDPWIHPAVLREQIGRASCRERV